jgi:phage baseplate assembly protein gpV
MVKQTKKLSTKTTVAQINATDKFPITDANGVVSLVTLATIKAAIMDGASLNAMYDGVFIMYHRKSDDYPLMVKPHKWTSIQSSGEIADGVVVVEGGKCLVVAPTESASKLTWSSAAISGGGTTTSDRVTAINDWNGKTNTAQQIAHSTSSAVTNTASYAPGFCNLYSRANANGKGLTAGKWWLPSLGEMMMIYANMTKINYALSLINGATQLVEDAYWTSTELSAAYAWLLGLSTGRADGTTKASGTLRVRAVSAFIA